MNELFLKRLKSELSEADYNKYIESLCCKTTHGFTINLKKLEKSDIDIEYIIKKFDANLIFRNNYFAYLTYDKEILEKNGIFPGRDPLYHVGLYYIQEPSAAKVLYDVPIKPSDSVLDMCASPGGKSIEVLYALDKNENGFLVANEIKYDRAKILSSNIERMGFDNTIVTCNEVPDLSKKFISFFDKIILDTPCSGEGMFRKSEEAVNQWSESLVTSCANTQKGLIDEAYKMLKEGGILIYSTCTFSREEDEDNVNYILNQYSDMKLVHMEKNYPFSYIGEGQFFAILRKEGMESCFGSLFPSMSDLKGLNVLRYGLNLEDDVNGRKQPSHASSHCDKVNFKNFVSLDDDEVLKYIHGEVLRKNVDFEGWCQITYKNMGLGIAKAVKGTLKNHYPKGLRTLY